MRKLQLLLAFLLAVGSVLGPVSAQTKKDSQPKLPVVVKFQVLQMTDKEASKLAGKKFLTGASGGRILSDSSLLTSTGSPSYYHTGENWPIIYFDPRAEQFQIQYVDIGLKVDFHVMSQGGDKFVVELRSETSRVHSVDSYDKPLECYPQTITFIQEARFSDVEFGKTLILTQAKGSGTESLLKSENLEQHGLNIVCLLSLERP